MRVFQTTKMGHANFYQNQGIQFFFFHVYIAYHLQLMPCLS